MLVPIPAHFKIRYSKAIQIFEPKMKSNHIYEAKSEKLGSKMDFQSKN